MMTETIYVYLPKTKMLYTAQRREKRNGRTQAATGEVTREWNAVVKYIKGRECKIEKESEEETSYYGRVMMGGLKMKQRERESCMGERGGQSPYLNRGFGETMCV